MAAVHERYGIVPNLFGVLAEAPTAIKAYFSLSGIFEQSSFTPLEQQVVLLAVSIENRCEYCVAAHSAIAKRSGVPDDVLSALRQGRPLPDARLNALYRLTRMLVEKRGLVSNADVSDFLDAGFSRANLLEIIVGIAQKTLSNYVNHIAATPVDAPFRQFAWKPEESAAAAEGT